MYDAVLSWSVRDANKSFVGFEKCSFRDDVSPHEVSVCSVFFYRKDFCVYVLAVFGRRADGVCGKRFVFVVSADSPHLSCAATPYFCVCRSAT